MERPIKQSLKELNKEQRKEYAVKTAQIVLNNLEPKGKSALYTQKQEQSLTDRVENRDPETKKKQPTVLYKLLEAEIAYIKINKISPQTLDELESAAKARLTLLSWTCGTMREEPLTFFLISSGPLSVMTITLMIFINRDNTCLTKQKPAGCQPFSPTKSGGAC